MPSDSPIESLKELRAKRVAVFKGTCQQLSVNRILDSFGLAERDVKTINMDSATARAALLTQDIDAVRGWNELFQLRDQGDTTKDKPQFTCNSTILASESL